MHRDQENKMQSMISDTTIVKNKSKAINRWSALNARILTKLEYNYEAA